MLDKLLTPEIEQLIKERNFSELKKIIIPAHPTDIAYLISSIENPIYKLFIFRMIPAEKSVEVFENLDHDQQQEILNSLTNSEIKNILNEMSADDRTDLFEDLPADLVKKFINFLKPQERKIAIEILNYPDYSVGRLINPDFVQLYEDITVEEALKHIRKVGIEKETVYHCYVIGRDKKLIGVVSLKKIVLAPPSTKIKDLMSTDIIKVNVYTDQEEAAKIFKKYDLIALPVIDNYDQLVGIVTFDDLVDVIEDETTEDFEKIAAVLPVEKPYMEAGFFELVWKRSFWLIILLALESLSGFVLKHYAGEISRMVALTFFIPILIGTGGNSGTQSATFVIRGLATGDIKVNDFFRIIFKEAALGIFIGTILAVCGVVRAFFQVGDGWLSITVGISIALGIIMANIVGAVLPLIFRRLKLDPALMSSPLITTIVDVFGIALYFEVARFLLGLH